MRLLFEGYYSRAAFIGEFTVHVNELVYYIILNCLAYMYCINSL